MQYLLLIYGNEESFSKMTKRNETESSRNTAILPRASPKADTTVAATSWQPSRPRRQYACATRSGWLPTALSPRPRSNWAAIT